MRKKKNAFTLIELLAVIVILAVILVIAVPRILDVIDASKKDSFKTSAQLIADSAEKKYVENKLNNIDEEITCENVTKLSKEDYVSCKITFDNEGNAKVSIIGKGKFKDLAICNGTKTSVELSGTCSTDAKYFAYEDAVGVVDKVTIKDKGKCIAAYLLSENGSEAEANTLCSGGAVNGITIEETVQLGYIPSTDYETAGLDVTYYGGILITGYSIEGGLDVVIPSNINGKKVVAIGYGAFTDAGVTPIGLGITSVVIPNTVKIIGDFAFFSNNLTSITFSTTPIIISSCAFDNNPITSDGDYTYPSNVIVRECIR